jgi:sensor histidine kinase YesM
VATAIVLASRWQRNEDARLEAEAARSESELRNLRSQINPHFLLNTLNNIYALTAFDQKRAQDAIKQLSEMLRHMLYDNQFNQVPLQDELNFLDSYVNLMKIRLPQNVEVTFTKDLQVPDLKIRPLMFIPLVENAFKHGVSPTEPSFVNICIKTGTEPVEEGKMCDTITCEIKNSNYPKTNQDRSGHGIGLMQTQRRLELAYPNRFEWVKGVSDDGNTYQSTIKIRL